MAQLAPFLDKYNTVIFDMDGVITSEQHYWTCAALTVWEWTHSDRYYGNAKIDVNKIQNDAKSIRKQVFCNDKIIEVLKAKGVNSNWDLGYVVFAGCMILDTLDFERVLDFANSLRNNILDEYPVIAKSLSEKCSGDTQRNGKLWYDMMLTFQEWFLGDTLFEQKFSKKPVNPGKKGFVYSEEPIIDRFKLLEILKLLNEKGKRLAIGTGRPENELYPPLKSFGIQGYFEPSCIINHNHVMAAEKKLSLNLTKPHPYIFIKALMGEEYSDEKIVKGEFDKSEALKSLVVGDAGADILAAKAMGADFCAVLTGISGSAARAYFEDKKAEYILKSLEDFLV